MHVIMEGKDYKDGELSVEEVFEYFKQTKKIPTTSATNSNEYEELFTNIRLQEPESIIIHIGYTSKASASFQGAVIAAREFEDIYLIDTLNVTGGLAAIVLYAARLLESNPSIEPQDLIEKVEKVIPKTRLAFIPGSLDFLKAGGRVSNVAYLGGTLLKLVPCIELVDGKLVSTKKFRGQPSVVTKKLMEDYLSQYDLDKEIIYLIYSIGLEEKIKEEMTTLAREHGFKQIQWMQAGAMISTHAGPGGFGIAGFEK